ncbi:hypothetical protein M0R45_019316 [Rubus argutus]|uniref:Uncharacterized protein n=1 Tax=Rubus argutus TaxID=59490 RepID=A0AAW1X6Q4_RUBAR
MSATGCSDGICEITSRDLDTAVAWLLKRGFWAHRCWRRWILSFSGLSTSSRINHGGSEKLRGVAISAARSAGLGMSVVLGVNDAGKETWPDWDRCGLD